MKHKSWIAGGVIAGGLVLFLNLYSNNMPDYSIRSKWKKLLLKNMLSDDVPKISVANAHAQKDRVLFVDAREPEEYQVSHIKGALPAGYNRFNITALRDVPKDQPMVIYCSIGKRSDAVARKLIDAGYRNVRNLYGGMFEWINKRYPVVDGKEQPTEKVHPFNSIWSKWLERGEKAYDAL